MKQYFILTQALFFFSFLSAQSLDYIPPHKAGISQEDYNKGKYFLENTYKQMAENNNVCYADYWNIALAYAYMGESSEKILELLHKSKEDHPEHFCYILSRSNEDTPEESLFYKIIGNEYLSLLQSCAVIGAKPAEQLTLKDQTHYEGYDYALLQQLSKLKWRDQKYRGQDQFSQRPDLVKKQRELDTENEQALQQLFEQYGGYIGESLVGEEWKDIACVILIHANSIAIQERFLPDLAEAAEEGELSKSVVRILVDKIQWKKTGRQIFGTQAGIPFEEEGVIRSFERKYKL